MAWPFASVAAPNLDSGPGVAIPTSATAITAAAAWLMGAHLKNTTGATITVTITDTAGATVVGPIDLPPNAEQPYEWAFRPLTGVKWVASDAGATGQIWGYE